MRALTVVVLGCVLAGCGSGRLTDAGATGVVPAGNVLSWPPEAAAVRLASDYETQLAGEEWSLAGGNTGTSGSALTMDGGLTWAVYSVGNITAVNPLISIAVDYSVTPAAPEDGTELYFAMANYAMDAWEWIDAPATADPWLSPTATGDDYVSAGNAVYLAVVLDGPGTAQIDSVSFTHAIEPVTVTTPENLTAEILDPGEVTLNWDAVAGAYGYNVYRSTSADMSGMLQVNIGPVGVNTFLDLPIVTSEYYFYQVTALGLNESDPSNTASVWCNGAGLPAPIGLQVAYFGEHFITVIWDWDDPGGEPAGFNLYIDTEPGFTLDSPTMEVVVTDGADRMETISSLDADTTYYWKMTAMETWLGEQGEMSGEVSIKTTGDWTWSKDVIGTGQGPVRAVAGDGVVALSYFNFNDVNFAIQDESEAGGWRVETPLPSSLGDFSQYQDLCYGGGSYLIGTLANAPGDSWVAEWDDQSAAGSWSAARIHGDGNAGSGTPKSGYHVACAASDTEFAVVHYFLTNATLLLHTRDISGGSWTETVIGSGFPAGCTLSNSLAYLDGNLYVLQTNNYADELFFGDRDGGWNWQDVRGAGIPKLAKYHDLQRFGDEWYTPGFYTSDKDLYVLHGDTIPWGGEQVVGFNGQDAGYDARMAVEGDEAVVVETQAGYFWFALASDNWVFQRLAVTGVTDFGPYPDVVLLDGSLYFAFENDETGDITVAKGTPPTV